MADRTPGPLWTGPAEELDGIVAAGTQTVLGVDPQDVVAVYPADWLDKLPVLLPGERAAYNRWRETGDADAAAALDDFDQKRAVYPAEGTPDRELDDGLDSGVGVAEIPDSVVAGVGGLIVETLSPAFDEALDKALRNEQRRRVLIAKILSLWGEHRPAALVVPAGDVDARVARKIDLLRDERDALAARCERLAQRCTDTDEQALGLAKTVDRADGQIKALTAEVDALRSVVRHALIHWSPKGPTPERVLLAEWDDTDWADSTWTPAEQKVLRDALDHIAAERDAIGQATEDRDG